MVWLVWPVWLRWWSQQGPSPLLSVHPRDQRCPAERSSETQSPVGPAAVSSRSSATAAFRHCSPAHLWGARPYAVLSAKAIRARTEAPSHRTAAPERQFIIRCRLSPATLPLLSRNGFAQGIAIKVQGGPRGRTQAFFFLQEEALGVQGTQPSKWTTGASCPWAGPAAGGHTWFGTADHHSRRGGGCPSPAPGAQTCRRAVLNVKGVSTVRGRPHSGVGGGACADTSPPLSPGGLQRPHACD